MCPESPKVGLCNSRSSPTASDRTSRQLDDGSGTPADDIKFGVYYLGWNVTKIPCYLHSQETSDHTRDRHDAEPDVLETRAQKPGSASDDYNRGLNGERTYAEISKPRISRGGRSLAGEQSIAAGGCT